LQFRIASLDAREEEFVDIVRTSGVRKVRSRTVQVTMPELQLPQRALMPAVPVVAELSDGRLHSHVGHPMTNETSWRGKGEMCPQGIAAQGGRIAGFGAYDVTDRKFSTSLGPPSCSPPV
jgi:hypothetical protein